MTMHLGALFLMMKFVATQLADETLFPLVLKKKLGATSSRHAVLPLAFTRPFSTRLRQHSGSGTALFTW